MSGRFEHLKKHMECQLLRWVPRNVNLISGKCLKLYFRMICLVSQILFSLKQPVEFFTSRSQSTMFQLYSIILWIGSRKRSRHRK